MLRQNHIVLDVDLKCHVPTFGSQMPGRNTSAAGAGYRYGFNGQEKDDEVSGAGNSNTAEFWQYDTRLGRRWNLDPKPTIGVSDYACFLNSPILFTDPDGDKVKFDNAKAFFKVIGKAITDKTFRQQLIAQHKATRITTQEVTDSKGEKHYEDVEHDQVFHYSYNKQSPNSLQQAANQLDGENAQRNTDGAHSSSDYYQRSFSDNSENVTLRGTGNGWIGGPKQKSSNQQYNNGTITINTAGTYDINNSTVTFYHGAQPIRDASNNIISVPIPAIGANGGGSMRTSTTIPFNFPGYAKIRMVVTSGSNSTGNPGALLLNVTINRP